MAVEPARHLFTVADYYRLDEAGFFEPDQRLELLNGEIFEMAPIGPPHGGLVMRLTSWFDRRVGDRAIVSVQLPVRLSDLSEPQPDLMLLRPRDDTYMSGHPRPDDVLLLIEVADTTARWDRRVKRPLYATHGIVEYWIVDVQARLIEVATEPSGGEYRTIEQPDPAIPAAFPDLALPLTTLFG